MSRPLINPELFKQLQQSAEEEARIIQDLKQHVEALDTKASFVQGLLSRVHSTPRAQYPGFLRQVEDGLGEAVEAVGQLATFANHYPYYQFNSKWSRPMHSILATAILWAWLGGAPRADHHHHRDGGGPIYEAELGHLLTLDEAGQLFRVPVNLRERDAFHITIEEYLVALVSITDELSRLAVNSVTLGDVAMAVRISGFIQDVHAGFQVLNLKNDLLRKRVDSVKYHVKKVEDVIYDLSLRNLLPVESEQQKQKQQQQQQQQHVQAEEELTKTEDREIKSEG